jgi:3-deoxy-D-manno-octulosonate 8-phosphate phosphatase (KDO 8-P phosphatase)
LSTDRAKKIKVILFDVDGVLTDGTLWFVPVSGTEPSAQQGTSTTGVGVIHRAETKGFSAHDGIGISLARLAGIKTGIVTKRISETVALRARDLKLEYVFQGIDRKPDVLDKILSESGVQADEICFVGDDLVDLPIMRRCGLAIAVANARPQVQEMAHYVTPSRGGEGAARDAIEYVLKAQGRLEQIINAYIEARS